MPGPLSVTARNTPVLARGTFGEKKSFPFVLAGLSANTLCFGKPGPSPLITVPLPAPQGPQALVELCHRVSLLRSGLPGSSCLYLITDGLTAV